MTWVEEFEDATKSRPTTVYCATKERGLVIGCVSRYLQLRGSGIGFDYPRVEVVKYSSIILRYFLPSIARRQHEVHFASDGMIRDRIFTTVFQQLSRNNDGVLQTVCLLRLGMSCTERIRLVFLHVRWRPPGEKIRFGPTKSQSPIIPRIYPSHNSRSHWSEQDYLQCYQRRNAIFRRFLTTGTTCNSGYEFRRNPCCYRHHWYKKCLSFPMYLFTLLIFCV